MITSVARDDLADGGAAGFAATIDAVRAAQPRHAGRGADPRLQGRSTEALDVIFAARPDVLNHNLETVARLHRAARPSAAYARSLALLARASDAGLLTKSGIILGMGETADEVRGAIADLRNVGVDVLTLGQYLRPSRAAPAGRALVDARGVRRAGRVRRGPRLRATSSRARSCAPATTPSGAHRCHAHRWPDVYAERLARARARMRELGVDVLLLSTGADLRTSPATRRCRSSGSRCSWCRPTPTRCS